MRKVLGYLSLCVILISLFGIIFKLYQNPVGFSYILESLDNFTSLPIPNFVESFTITADWGVLDFLRNFLNMFTTTFGVILNICGYITNLFYYMYQFMEFLLIK